MKKNLKIIMTLVLSLAMVLSVSAVSFAGTAATSKGEGVLADGTYKVTVKADLNNNGRMFYIATADKNTCKLIVKDGVMIATVRLNGTGYDKLFMGTAEEAEKADASSYINYVEDAEQYYTFQVPVASFNNDLNVAAYGTRGKAWRDHTLTFSYSETMVTPARVSIKSAKAFKNRVKLTWKAQAKNTAGYQIRYSMKKAMNNAKTVRITSNSTANKTIKKLKSNKRYYFQMRAYNRIGNKYYYSRWSVSKNVKVK